jgi:enoyl-CoA hydratase/carnithine racemase
MTIQVLSISPPNGKNPLNPLSKLTRKSLSARLKDYIQDPNVSSIILFGGKNFSAGADIS